MKQNENIESASVYVCNENCQWINSVARSKAIKFQSD